MKKLGYFSRERVFYKIFDTAVLNITKATSLLLSIMLRENFDNIESKVKEMRELEHEGDLLTHDIMKKLNMSSINPIYRKDIHALASRLDDILDQIWVAVDKLSIFKLNEPTKEAIGMSKNLLMITEVLTKAIRKLKEKKYSQVQEYCIEIHKLENRIDRIFRDALERMFDESKDPILVIKWKDIYQHLEDASDRCEDAANILKAIVLKHA